MKRSVSFHLLIIALLVTLSGCSTIIDWTREMFYQGEEIESNIEFAQQYLRSEAAYNQLETAAIFDALWLSDDVRETYVDLHVSEFGKNKDQHNNMLRRQLEENKHYINFYVLSLFEVPLAEAHVDWAVYLSVNGINYAPVELKTIELSPEWRKLFGRRYSRFKQPYSVKFNAQDIQEQPIITEEVREMALHFRSLNKEMILVWEFDEQGKMVQKKNNKKVKNQN